MKKSSYIILTMIAGLILMQCNHRDELDKHGKYSKAGSRESHNFGQNCMTCHNDPKNEASSSAWWNIAGSSQAVGGGDIPATTGHIELWSEQDRQGTMYLSLDIDALGNFYTEKIVDFKGKCYPVLVAPDGQYSYMSDPYTSGGCNSCHDGNTTDRLQLPG